MKKAADNFGQPFWADQSRQENKITSRHLIEQKQQLK